MHFKKALKEFYFLEEDEVLKFKTKQTYPIAADL
jgi:hypothetical protein